MERVLITPLCCWRCCSAEGRVGEEEAPIGDETIDASTAEEKKRKSGRESIDPSCRVAFPNYSLQLTFFVYFILIHPAGRILVFDRGRFFFLLFSSLLPFRTSCRATA